MTCQDGMGRLQMETQTQDWWTTSHCVFESFMRSTQSSSFSVSTSKRPPIGWTLNSRTSSGFADNLYSASFTPPELMTINW